jgi:hypothetical protein
VIKEWTDSTLFAQSEGQISSILGDEAIILNSKTGKYYGLGSVGARVWQLLQNPKSVADVLTILLDEYDVESHQCERDILQLMQQLDEEGMIQTHQ